MIYTEAEHFIKESHNEVIRLGLGRIEELLERLGCPQKKLKFIHVAGTNGKGSVCAMTAETPANWPRCWNLRLRTSSIRAGG